jgi:ParB family chromosome partitioning protein
MRIEDAKIRIVDEIQEKSKNKSRSSVYTEDYKGEYYNIPLGKLIPFQNQARRFFDPQSLESLASTIREHGVRQPLTVIPSEIQEGKYEIVSGERRYRASLQVGLETVPCIILHDRQKVEEISIIENIQREDLHPVELMKAYNSLLKNGICSSMQEIADKIRIAKSAVVETINLKNLSEKTQDLLVQNKIINRDFFRLLCKENINKQQELVEQYIKNQQIKKAKQSTKRGERIVSLVLSKGSLFIDENKLNTLSSEQKHDAKNIIQNIIDNLL